jgi:hypothetical protein
MRMIAFLYYLPSLAPAPGESWAEVWGLGHRAIEGLTLAAAWPHRRLDALKIEGLWPVVREHLREAVEVSRRRRAEALEAIADGKKEGFHCIQFLDELPSFLPAGRPSEGESTAFREGLLELKRLSLCLEAERAGKHPRKPKKPGGQKPPGEGEWSTPMSLAQLMTRLRANMDPRKFKDWLERDYGLQKISRQSYQVCLDKMPRNLRVLLEGKDNRTDGTSPLVKTKESQGKPRPPLTPPKP